MPIVAIIDPLHPAIIEAIRAALPPYWALAVARSPALADQQRALRNAEVAFIMAARVTGAHLVGAEKLGLIQKLGGGYDQIDLEACRTAKVGVARLLGGSATPVAEHTVLLMLAAYRRLPRMDRDTRARKWNREAYRTMNRQLRGKTIGLIGLGAIGQEVAKLLSGFGVTIRYYAPRRAAAAVEVATNAAYVSLDDLLSGSDIVSLHLPLTNETKGFLSVSRIGQMKPGALLVNTARGGLVDEAALAAAIVEGRIFGAAVDSFSVEPPVDSPLLNLEKTIVTPHAAGSTIDNISFLAERAVQNATLYLAGEDLPAGDVVLAPSRRRPVQ